MLRWPTPSMAQMAGMSTEVFEDFYFDACTIDYGKMEKAMEPLVQLMKEIDEVRIVGPGVTDISFSIKGMPQVIYAGEHNIPDGEIMTAPIRDSINGIIHFNTPSIFYGSTFKNIYLEFKNGKVIRASCNLNERINEILDQDEGARFIGEFAFGLNPYISKNINDILFDEKIKGSIHLALGNSYKECDNGNRSAIHWDLILIQTSEFGGGTIYFDNKIVRKDGYFVLDDLRGLNSFNP